MGKAISHLHKMMDTRLLMSHGPIDWLLEEEYSEDLTAIVQRVLSERFQAWSQSGKAKTQIKRDRKMAPETKRKQENLLNTRTRDSEREIILRGYREATEIPGHRPGKFMAAYILMSIRDSKRIKRRSNRGNDPKGNNMTWKPITTTRSLSALPVEEHRGYFERGRTAPTAIVRTRERIDPCHIGARCRIKPIVQGSRITGVQCHRRGGRHPGKAGRKRGQRGRVPRETRADRLRIPTRHGTGHETQRETGPVGPMDATPQPARAGASA